MQTSNKPLQTSEIQNKTQMCLQSIGHIQVSKSKLCEERKC